MSTVLLFIVADFIIKLLQIVFQSSYFIFSGTDGVFQTHDVFITLLNDFFLVSDPVLSGFNLSKQALL